MRFPSSPEAIRDALIYVIALIMCVAVHEFGHAFVADKLGDRLARSEGRVTLNPLAHIDPIGTIVLPLLLALGGGAVFGWGRPVRHALHARYVPRWMSMRTAHLFVSVAGPAMNIVLALVLGLPYALLFHAGYMDIARLVSFIITMNVGLAVFNLIPVPPLDGRSVLFWFFDEGHPVERFLTQYGPFILLGLFYFGTLRYLMIPVQYVAGYWIHFLRALA